MALFEPQSLTRIAVALERLVALQEAHLAALNIRLETPDSEGEGEILGTDDVRIAEAIAREVFNRPDREGAGLFVGEPNGLATPPAPPGAEVQAGWDHPSLFGSSWGLNAGPEGAEEDWGGPPSHRSTGESTPRDVREQGDSEKQEV